MAADHGAVDRHASARVYQHGVADPKFGGIDLAHPAGAAHRNRARQELQEIADRMATARDRHALQHLGDQHEQRNDERGEKFADRRRRDDGDGHGQFHGHAPGEEVLERLPEDRPAADHEADDADRAHARDRLPDLKPHGRRGKGDERDPRRLRPREAMRAFILGLHGRRRRGARMRRVGQAGLVLDRHPRRSVISGRCEPPRSAPGRGRLARRYARAPDRRRGGGYGPPSPRPSSR